MTAAAETLARIPAASPEALADALAASFLASKRWDRAGLTAETSALFFEEPRWIGSLLDEIFEIYRAHPHDRPRELRGVILASPVLERARDRARDRGIPLRMRHHGVVEPAPTPGFPATLPELADLLGITAGELDWFADTRDWNRLTPIARLRHYRETWIERPARVPRLLEVPGSRLRRIQRIILEEILQHFPSHDAAHGFIAGRSAVTGARRHLGADVVIALDLTTFFARVGAGTVYGALRRAGLSEPVSHTLAGLGTQRTPPQALRRMPRGGDPDRRDELRRALAMPHLPQGAPTSPALANLAAHNLDRRLTGYAEAAGATYTRYADDLTFSGGLELRRHSAAFIRGVDRIVADEGHALNRAKTRVQTAARSQRVTGIIVNQVPNIPRTEYDALRAILHNCVRFGPHSQNRGHHPEFRAHLLGRISWTESLNPGRGRKLRELFRRIDWTAASTT